MMPRLFSIGPFTVYSYGLMLGIAFIVGSYFLSKSLEKKGIDPNIGTEVTLLAIIFGIVGAKMFSLFENWDAFLAHPIAEIFSPGGLTFYGGFLLAVLAIFIYMKRKKIRFLDMADAAAPSLALSYGIGRIGCHLAGDGDYGIPTSLPWGVDYSNGVSKPSEVFMGSSIAEKFPNGIVPNNTPLHPTPLYEFFLGLIIFMILWNLRKKPWPAGKLFMVYLVLAGSARFLVEFIRLNPSLLFGLSEAQLISIGLIIAGITGLYRFSKTNKIKNTTPAPVESGTK